MPLSSAVKVSSTSAPSVISVLSEVTDVPLLAVSKGRGLLGDLGDLEGDGLLGLVRMRGTRVDLELLDDLSTQLVLGEHAPDGLLDDLASVLVEQLPDRGGGEAPRVARVAVGELVGQLVAGQGDLLGVDDDDEVTGVDVRRVDRLVLAAQQVGTLDREPAQDDVGRVDDVPGALDVSGPGAVGAHESDSLVRRDRVGGVRRGGGATPSDEHGP